MNTHDENWSNFTHTTLTSDVNAQELFEHYREFQKFIAGFSRKELVERHWLKTMNDDSSLENIFFDLPLSKQPTLFRKSSKANESLLAIWQARAQADAQYIYLSEDVRPFTSLTKDNLKEFAALSVDPQIIKRLPSVLSEFGIILVYIHSLPGMNADGAIFYLSTGNPVIAMSLRFPRLDYFWFTLLHELAHLVLHTNELKGAMFFDVENSEESDRIERAANRLAKDSIVARESWRSCAPKYDPTDRTVRTYAAQQSVHPSLIAGLLRKESGNYKRFSSIINEYNVREIIFKP